MAGNFNKQQLRLPSLFSLNNKNKDRFVIDAFRGNVTINVWQTGNTAGGPVVKIPLPASKARMIRKLGKRLLNLGPNTEVSVHSMKFDSESRKWTPEEAIKFGKSDKNTYYLEVTSKKIDGGSIQFPFWGNKKLIGTTEDGKNWDDLTTVSEEDFESFLDVLDKGYFHAAYASYMEAVIKGQGGGSGSNSSNQKTSSSSSSSNDFDDGDDVPF